MGDPLRIWREVTAEHGVALYMHYSGVWDSEAIIRNPSWGVIQADSKLNGDATSRFGPYAQQLLIPQLRELAGEYGVDGVWVDGDCWASVPDFGPAALQAFSEATGIEQAPRGPDDPHWFEFLQFHRDAFRRYLRNYITEVKKTHPDFQVCSNWAFTDHMPEPVSAPVDFLSGDYSPEDSVNSARLSARYLARQGTPWDLMAWSFTHNVDPKGSNQKTAVQLQREAAVVLAVGGGFQAYFKQKRDGSIYPERVPVMAEVAKFCRARQALCHRAQPVPQVALLFSTPAHYRRASGLFSRELSHLHGTLQALLESQLSVEVLGEHHLAGRLAEYPLVIVPEWEYLEPAFKDQLVDYVSGGGNLLLVGSKTASMFAPQLDVTLTTLTGQPTDQPRLQLTHQDLPVVEIDGQSQSVQLGQRAKAFGQLQGTDAGAPVQPAASIASWGQGKVAATYFTFGRGYLRGRSQTTRQFLYDLARQLFPTPLVEVHGSHDVDVVVNRVGGRLAVNLVNTAGPHQTSPIHETVPLVGPLQITLRTPQAPARISVQPGDQVLPFEYDGGEAKVTLPELEIHSVILVEE